MSDHIDNTAEIEDHWNQIAVVLRESLISAGGPEHAIEWVIADLRPRAIEIMLSISALDNLVLQDDPHGPLDLMKSFIERHVAAPLIGMIQLEFELYRAIFARPVTADKQPDLAPHAMSEAPPAARLN
jgi:hypothetical protein